MKLTTVALITIATFLLHSLAHGGAKKRKINLTKKPQRCSRICPPGRECQVLSDGSTKQCVCLSRCKKKYKPVCGTDGKLYNNHCELHRTACKTGKKIRVDWDFKCFKKDYNREKDCPKKQLSKMQQLILETFQKELHGKEVTSKVLIDELYFRYNSDRDDSISGSELKRLVTDYLMYPKVKKLVEICHSKQWLRAQDKDQNGILSKDEFSRSFASKPEISILKSEEEPISGSNLTLQCRARGYPVPVVTWYKDQIKLNKTEHASIFSDGKLSIEKLESGDGGVYACKALNNMGMDKKHVEIKVQEPVTRDSSVTTVQGGNMFYVFANDGVYVINAETSTTINHIRADDVINGTTKPICTRSQQKACNWGGAVSVNLIYVYVADFLGQRVLVLDIAAQKFVEEVPTDYYPYQLKYLRSLDAVWILSWENSSLEVLTEDEDDNGTLSVISNASKMILHTATKPMMNGYRDAAHGFFAAENCELTEEKYGYVTHIMEPGLHEVDLVTRRYTKFYNFSEHQCYGTFDLALSQPHKYAFVQCYTNKDLDSKAQLVIDLKENQLEAKSEQYFGTSFASPDGRFIITLNYYAILTQYIDPAGQIFLFPEIESNILLSHLAFYPRNAGYDVYVTSKDQSTIIVLHVDQRGIDTLKFISGVGKPLQEDWIHTQRPIVIGCEAGVRYLATPATGEDLVIILDAERKEMSGKVGGIKGAQTILWVGNQQE